jgi:uncharacterized membrane protein
MRVVYTDFMNRYNTASDAIVFSARLTPYRSLGPQGFRILIASIGGVCFVVGMVFFAFGLWPVVGFLGLDVLLVYCAFRSNYAAARAYEDIVISKGRVLLRKVSPQGRIVNHAFPRLGTRFEINRHDEIGITHMKLSHRRQSVELGRFLNPPDRESFATALQNALVAARQ